MKLDWKKTSPFTWIAIVLMAAFALTACSDDKDDEPEAQDTSTVVGVWKQEFSSGYQLLTLGRDGSYSLVEFDYEGGNWSDTGTYFVKNNTMTIVCGDEREIYTILTLTRNKMVLRYEGGDILYNNSREEYEDIEEWTRVE